MVREIVELKESDLVNFIGNGPWVFGGETYNFIEDVINDYKFDFETWEVIVMRSSDSKYFKFNLSKLDLDKSYYYNKNKTYIKEVFKKRKTIDVWV